MPTEATAVAVEAPPPPVIKLRRRREGRADRRACCERVVSHALKLGWKGRPTS